MMFLRARRFRENLPPRPKFQRAIRVFGRFQLETGGANPETRAVHWKKVTLVGVGLLGGSLGLALLKRRLASEVVGYVRRDSSLAECLECGAVTSATLDLSAAVQGADLVVLCTPISRMSSLAGQMLPSLKRGALVTDVGSVKGTVVRQLSSIVNQSGVHFVGSHPMAGAEKTGVTAARADLFNNAVCVITPTDHSRPQAVKKVEALWRDVGCQVLCLSPKQHDLLVSRSSHLPHVLAALLTNLVLNPTLPPEQEALCANGFRDCTRIASGSPEMWRDIALANRRNLSDALRRFVRELEKFNRTLSQANPEAILKFFESAKHRRDAWSAQSNGTSPE
jgi:prephenate dehydrogenase